MVIALEAVSIISMRIWPRTGALPPAKGCLTDQHRLALAGGALMFFVLLTPLIELDTAWPDNPTGMTIMGLVTLLFLIWLWWRVRGRIRKLALVRPRKPQTRDGPGSRKPGPSDTRVWIHHRGGASENDTGPSQQTSHPES